LYRAVREEPNSTGEQVAVGLHIEQFKYMMVNASKGNLLYVVVIMHYFEVMAMNRSDKDRRKELTKMVNLFEEDGELGRGNIMANVYSFIFSNYMDEHFEKYVLSEASERARE
jgi:hypothetical protein